VLQLIDTHAHLTFDGLIENIDAVLERSRQAGVIGWVTVGTSPDENPKCIELAQKYDGMYAAIGYHPHYAKDISAENLAELKELAKQSKVIAIGEIGLDFHYNFSKQDAQKDIFMQQLRIASDLNLPVIVHSREAFKETVEILDQFKDKLKRVVFHCFGGNAQEAKFLVERGFYISFTGVITFKSAAIAREAVKEVPLDRLMIETDCPYMSPDPMRKQKLNEPALMVHTAAKITEIKGITLDEFAAAVTKTTKIFFEI
jgi:TatD DNase family protein